MSLHSIVSFLLFLLSFPASSQHPFLPSLLIHFLHSTRLSHHTLSYVPPQACLPPSGDLFPITSLSILSSPSSSFPSSSPAYVPPTSDIFPSTSLASFPSFTSRPLHPSTPPPCPYSSLLSFLPSFPSSPFFSFLNPLFLAPFLPILRTFHPLYTLFLTRFLLPIYSFSPYSFLFFGLSPVCPLCSSPAGLSPSLW